MKVGRLVTVSFFIDVSNIGTASGAMTLSGLPFNTDGTSQQYQEGFGRLNSIPSQSSPASGFVGFQLGPNQSYGDVQFAASTGITSVTAANLDTAWDCVGTITYIAVQ